MTDDAHDADLEIHIRGFLAAINERPGELIAKHFAQVRQPDMQEAADLRRYINDLKRVYGQGLLEMYQRVASHGRALCELTDETEITGPVQEITRLITLDGQDVPRILASFDDAAKRLNAPAIAQLFTTLQVAAADGLSRQAQRDAVILDFTAYCLNRFPPAEES
jgi:hypothetical protein